MKKFISCFICLSILCGCASIATRELNQARTGFANDDFVAAADKYAGEKSIQDQNSLQLLMTGLAHFQAKNYKQSDDAFEEFNKRNYDTIGGSIMYETTSLLGGQMASEYKPSMMDSLFVSYYQIWDAIGENRKNDVRVIINQSYARQQDMSIAYADLVKKNSERINNEKTSELMTELQKQNSMWTAYTDIMNPALMYLSGIWFLTHGDFSDARTYLNRASGMVPENSFITADLNLVEKKSKPKNTTWVFIESGFAPTLQEKELSLPVLTGNGAIVVSIAVAEPVFWNGKTTVSNAQPLADVNAMFMTEFNQYRVNDALRSFSAASARAIAQALAYNSNSKYSGLLGLGATLFSVTTTSAEVRTWVTLPESISVLRLNTADLIDSNLSAIISSETSLPKSGNHLIYVRLTENKPVVHIFKI